MILEYSNQYESENFFQKYLFELRKKFSPSNYSFYLTPPSFYFDLDRCKSILVVRFHSTSNQEPPRYTSVIALRI